MQIFIDITLA